jgi:hypothetical protein
MAKLRYPQLTDAGIADEACRIATEAEPRVERYARAEQQVMDFGNGSSTHYRFSIYRVAGSDEEKEAGSEVWCGSSGWRTDLLSGYQWLRGMYPEVWQQGWQQWWEQLPIEYREQPVRY